jgi:hypothetical protein
MNNPEMSSHRSLWPVIRAGILLALVPALAFGAPAPKKAPAAQEKKVEAYPTASWAVLDAVATIALDTKTLSDLGLETTVSGTSNKAHSLHPLSVVPEGSPSFEAAGPYSTRLLVGADGFHGFEGGALQLAGGFRLQGLGADLNLSRLTLRPKGSNLELVDAAGVALITTAASQWEFDARTGELRYLNADLRALPALARLLGDDRYTDMNVGVLDIDIMAKVGAVPAGLPPVGNAPPPCGDWSGVLDVSLTNISSVAQAGVATINGRSVVVVLPSADLKNVGTANVPWYSKFTNLNTPPWNDQHPFLVWQMVRNAGGVLEPIGRSDLKHAFLTLNNGCDAGACTDSHVLGLGCTDVYGTGTNNQTNSLAPRNEVTASTGIWAHCGGIPTHFDTNGDCVQDFSGGGENSFTHGLKAAETDLQVAGASYYMEAFYIIRNDTNIFNSMGYKPVTPAKPGSTWTFNSAGAYTLGPAINAWVNPTTPGAGNDNRVLDTGEGHVQLAVRTFQVPGNPSRTRYAYALQNHDFDRQIKSFRIPFNTAGVVVENMAYADGDGFTTNNWTATVDAGGIVWTAPSGTTPPAEQDYASLISFRFDSDKTAAAVNASLGVFEAGNPSSLSIQTLGPATAAPAGANFYTLTPCRLLDTRTQPGFAIASGTVLDVNASGTCGIPAGASAVAINVTAVGATSSGDIAVYSADPPTTGSAVVNFSLGSTRANNAVAAVSVDGKLKVKPTLSTNATTHIVIDVVGYFQ